LPGESTKVGSPAFVDDTKYGIMISAASDALHACETPCAVVPSDLTKKSIACGYIER